MIVVVEAGEHMTVILLRSRGEILRRHPRAIEKWSVLTGLGGRDTLGRVRRGATLACEAVLYVRVDPRLDFCV
jgi:hypothetical protein